MAEKISFEKFGEARLHRIVSSVVSRFARMDGYDSDLSDDLTSECYLWCSLNHEKVNNFIYNKGLFLALHNIILNRLKTINRIKGKVYSLNAISNVSEDFLCEDGCEKDIINEVSNSLIDDINTLPVKTAYKDMVNYYYNGLTTRDISGLVGKRYGTTRSSFNRACTILRDQLNIEDYIN